VRTARSPWPARVLLAVLGRHAEALQHLRVAERADPLSTEVRRTLALVLISVGRYDEAADHCRQLPSPRLCLGLVRSGQVRFGEAIQLLAHHPDLSRNPQTRGFLGYAYAQSGRREEAAKMAAASQYANEQALLFAGLGDKDRTLEALDRMTVLGMQRIGLYLNYPQLALLREDPRLKAFRKKVGLPE
jgi:tetratricopeptide (TPR) repeat protein